MFGWKQGQNIWTWLKLTESCLDYWSLGIFFLFEAWNSRFCSTGTFLSSVGMHIHQSEATSGAKTACPDTYLTDLRERCLGENKGRIFEHDWNWLNLAWTIGLLAFSFCLKLEIVGSVPPARSCLQLVCTFTNLKLPPEPRLLALIPTWLTYGKDVWVKTRAEYLNMTEIDWILPGLLVSWHFLSVWSLK